MAKPNEMETPSVNLIGAGTVIKGDIKANGDIRIDGTLIGSIQSKGKVILGQSGVVEGEIICQSADISGTIKAQLLQISELLTLKATAKVTGDIVVNKLAIEPGAKFSGSCNMNETGAPKDVKPSINEPIAKKEPVV